MAATYVLPQVLVFQEFDLIPAVEVRDLPAFICGGYAYLARCDEADEKATAGLGEYDNVGSLIDGEFKTCYSWPGKPVGSVIDETYTKLCIDNALLRYFRDTSDTIKRSDDAKLRHPTKNWKENPSDPTTYPRHADFKDRDVAIGDIVKVTAQPDPSGSSSAIEDEVVLCTYVKDIEATQVAATIDAATLDTANNATQSAPPAASSSAGSGNSGDATIASIDQATFDGLEDGNITEVYTITVTQASTGGDATTARLRVTSASGNDDDADFTPDAAFGAAVTLGSRAATVTFAGGSTEFTLNDTWDVTVNQDFTAPVATSAGTYTGLSDESYIIEVTKGGDASSASPEITVTTTTGTDFSGPTVIPNQPSAIAVGSKGVTIQWDTDQFVKGDRWHVVANAATDGAFNILVLGHNLHDDIQLEIANMLIEVSLYIKKDLEVGEEHVAIPGQYNWTQSDTEFCANAGIQAYDTTWTDSGVLVALDVISDADCSDTNQMYVEYRAWRSDIATVETISDVSALDLALDGALTPDNELKWAVFKALSNSNGQDVKYMAVADPDDTSSWISVLDEIEERTDVYGLVPLTTNKTILDLFAAHVDAQSTETAGRWRVLWTSLVNTPTVEVVSTDTDGATLLATTEDDTDTSGTQYTILKVSNQDLEDASVGVRTGDVVRFQYLTDAFGNVTYNEYVVDAVINENTLRLATGTALAVSVAQKVEIWRDLTLTEQADAVAAKSGNWANRRVMSVWPDTVGNGGTTFAGYHLCAALAGLRSGVVPHQSLTHLEIAGFDDLTRTTELFNRTQLDTLAVNGTWIVTAHPESNEIFARHAVTTADYEVIEQREEMITSNVDAISYYFQEVFAPYIGVSNVTPSMIDIIESETLAGVQFLKTSNFTPRLGGQLIDAVITDLRISPVFKDRIILGIDITVPFALNNLEIHLLV